MERVLVSGGAGYIGSHTVKVLRERGVDVVVVDNLVTGHKEAVPADVPFYLGDISDGDILNEIMAAHPFSAVVHFAAQSLVGESMVKPDQYFEENTAKTNRFVAHLLRLGVKNLVFSSTAATYGNPEVVPIPEESRTQPVNPYGLSKLMIEECLRWFETAYGLRWIALRYFNAAGAALDGSIGEDHATETHLIPLILKTALGQRESISVFGTDYATPDGTCIRDYIHVLDLAEAHVRALVSLEDGAESGIYNVGTGAGYSVMEVIQVAKEVTGQNIPMVKAGRRAGDPDVLVAKTNKIQERLGWEALYSDLETIVRSAWTWHKKHPKGFAEINQGI